MKTFKMYVKTVIFNEQDKILLLNKKIGENNPNWDLPGAAFTEEQSFDETVINNVQKEIGFYVYPGKIIGIADYSNQDEKEVNVIMEGNILNGDLLLSKEYDSYAWIPLSRIKEYPLAPWLNDYMQHNKNPFGDVESEIEEITDKSHRRHSSSRIDFRSNASSKRSSEGVKSSFGLLKDTIIRTFHPQQAKIKETTPKSNEIYQENTDEEYVNEEYVAEENIDEEKAEKQSIKNMLNINFKKNKKEEISPDIILKDNEDDIIIEHDDTASDEPELEIIIEDEDEETETETQTSTENSKIFDMNINKQYNMKKGIEKIKKPIKKIKNATAQNESREIKVIHKNEEIPHIRKEKESLEKISFNSENIKRSGWKERLNEINRTEANDKKKSIPRPKGRRK
ncbi:MAG: hypothetical protein BZ138_02830 [Methanosphaera sp. rholeuAM270]|nr:MAG: hypothetical protein BZ138_02830 [Methanosphaera sp. rholeuAM270]